MLGSVLEPILASGSPVKCEDAGKELAKASFLILDSVLSRARYTMKRDKKVTVEYLRRIQQCEDFDIDLYKKLIGSYELLLRRADRNRLLLFDILKELEYLHSKYPCDEIEDVLFFGFRSLAHIDIMISLHKEQLSFYRKIETL